MPKIITITCDACGKPAKEYTYDGKYYCDKHYDLKELSYLKDELTEKSTWYGDLWENTLKDLITQIETIINANSN